MVNKLSGHLAKVAILPPIKPPLVGSEKLIAAELFNHWIVEI